MHFCHSQLYDNGLRIAYRVLVSWFGVEDVQLNYTVFDSKYWYFSIFSVY